MVHKTLHCLPGIEQSHPVVVKDAAVLIARILLVSRLKRKRSVDQVEIQIVEPESVETRLECRFDALRPVIGVPQFRGNKKIFARDSPSGKSCLQRLAYLALVPVSFSTIEVSKSGFKCGSGRSYRHGCVGNQGAEAECGHMTRSVVERHSRHSKIRGFDRGCTSTLFCVPCINVRIQKLYAGAVTARLMTARCATRPEAAREKGKGDAKNRRPSQKIEAIAEGKQAGLLQQHVIEAPAGMLRRVRR